MLIQLKKGEKLEVGTEIIRSMPVEIKSVNRDTYTLTAVVSTQDPDRHGDSVIQAGWILDPYNKNAVILDSHNYSSATKVIGVATRTEVVGTGKRAKLEQDIKFAVDQNPLAKVIFELYAGGFLKAFSVGFIVREFGETADGKTDWYVIKQAELLEVSAVSVPANARALAKSKGIEVEQLDAEDDSEGKDDEPEADDAPEDEPEAPELSQGDAGEPETATEPEQPETAPEQAPEVAEVVPEPEPEQKLSPRERMKRAIDQIREDENRQLRKAGAIITSLLKSEGMRGLSDEVEKKVRKRKIHQVIRSLINATGE